MALILGISTIGILTSVSTSLLANSLLRAISETTLIVKKLANYDKPTYEEIKKLLDKLDIEFTLKIISLTIEEINKKVVGTELEVYDKKPNAIKTAIYYITDTISIINEELSKIYSSASYHNSKYFKEWRMFECECNIEKIKSQKKILDKRYKVLIDLIKISKI